MDCIALRLQVNAIKHLIGITFIVISRNYNNILKIVNLKFFTVTGLEVSLSRDKEVWSKAMNVNENAVSFWSNSKHAYYWHWSYLAAMHACKWLT